MRHSRSVSPLAFLADSGHPKAMTPDAGRHLALPKVLEKMKVSTEPEEMDP